MATCSSILTGIIPCTEEPGRLQSMGSQRVRHDRATEHTGRQGLSWWSSGQDFTFQCRSVDLIPGQIPWMEESGGLQSMGLLRVRQDRATSLSLFTFMHWRRRWQPTSVFLPGESRGRGSLVGCHLWGRTESDTTEMTKQASNVNLKIHFENLLQFKVLILNEYHFYINPNNNLNHYEHYLFM